jgi:hypothetical protein
VELKPKQGKASSSVIDAGEAEGRGQRERHEPVSGQRRRAVQTPDLTSVR